MTQLSLHIAHLRSEKPGKPRPAWQEMLVKRISNHYAPFPIFREYHDTDEINKIIVRRNKIVLFFWLGVVAVVVGMLLYKRFFQADTTDLTQ